MPGAYELDNQLEGISFTLDGRLVQGEVLDRPRLAIVEKEVKARQKQSEYPTMCWEEPGNCVPRLLTYNLTENKLNARFLQVPTWLLDGHLFCKREITARNVQSDCGCKKHADSKNRHTRNNTEPSLFTTKCLDLPEVTESATSISRNKSRIPRSLGRECTCCVVC